ncbi:hypothetical protein, variant [Aphanomyces astaci]|uniref:CCT domain-containing protein n=1 Tax=Aphanomyces astaci TaxID=112090 RepID=W4H481_APHAT|nr:hypothetical protein, variant [Aphanomyces astaci]ETV86825.1 hypothetical protein, variant [Aphanomyces astaci]|eukprot:XP_009823624.1 hypothetical protein, variant [Aphanomyces astaci]
MNIAARKGVLDGPSRVLFDGMRVASPPQATHATAANNRKDSHSMHDATKEAHDLLKSQELFLSVVLDWQQHESTDTSVHGDSSAPSEQVYTSSFESSEGSDHEGGAATRLMNFTRNAKPAKPPMDHDPSPTNIPPSKHLPALNLNTLLPLPKKRIGIYSPRSRRELLEKYMEKRTKRLSRKKVRYRVRKTLANARPRVKGRFVKTDQPLTAAAVEEMEKARTPSSKAKSATKPNTSDNDFDYVGAYYSGEDSVRDDVQDMLRLIVASKREQGEDINWEEWASQLEHSILSLLPSQYVESPFPEVFSDVANTLGDAEEDCSMETFVRAVRAGTMYVAICLSQYISLRPPSMWEHDDDVSPVLQHYLPEIKQLWAQRRMKKNQTFEFMEGAIPGIAAVVCLGYADGKRHLKPIIL